MTRTLVLSILIGLTAGAAGAESIIVQSDQCMTADVAYQFDEDDHAPVDLNPWRAEFDFRHAYVAVPTDGRRGRRGQRVYIPVDLEGDPYGASLAESCED